MTLEEQFANWWAAHRGIYYKVARSFTQSPGDEADLIQEMLLQVWRSQPHFRGTSKPTTWLYRVCLNTALTWKKTEARRSLRFPLEGFPDTVPDSEHSPERASERKEKVGVLYDAMRALPEGDRTLLLLHLDGLSYQEIGEIVGMDENRVGVGLTRARKKLSNLLEEVRHEL